MRVGANEGVLVGDRLGARVIGVAVGCRVIGALVGGRVVGVLVGTYVGAGSHATICEKISTNPFVLFPPSG
jgi:uncharacterized membrane protein